MEIVPPPYGSRLFSPYSLRDRIYQEQNNLVARVQGMKAEEILPVTSEAVAQRLAQEVVIDVPTLLIDRITVTVGEEHYSFRDERRNVYERMSVLMQRYEYHIPFEGDRSIFSLRPTQLVYVEPILAHLDSQELRIVVIQEHPNATQVKTEFDARLRAVQDALKLARTEVASLISGVEQALVAAATKRRELLTKAGQVAADLGYPLRKREDAARFAPPIRRKRIDTTPAKTIPGVPAVEPHLPEQAFREILQMLESMSLLIERNPTTFAHIPEEVLRDHFLLQLNAQFEGQATGETFNGQGKTDILLRHQNRNLFIAECKYWKGPKSFVEAIDQLFEYLTWRDTKAAVLVFNRNRGFTRVITETRTALKDHPQFRSEIVTGRETIIRARMAKPKDEERILDLAVLFFDVPDASQAAEVEEDSRQ